MTPTAVPSTPVGPAGSALLCLGQASDASELASALATEGYDVENVPPDALVARADSRTGVVIADIDARDALHAVATLQEQPHPSLELVVFASSETTLLAKVNQVVTRGVGALFVKPILVPAVVSKLRLLRPRSASSSGAYARVSSIPPSGPSQVPPSGSQTSSTPPPIDLRSSAPPPPEPKRASSLPPPSATSPSSPPSPAPRFATLPPVGTRGSAPPVANSVSPSRAPSGLPGVPEAVLLQAGLSQELAELLLAAESRITDYSGDDGGVPSPAEEIEAVLPREVLAVLDTPLDDDDDDDFAIVEGPSVTTGGRRSGTTGVGDDAEHFTRDDVRDADLDTRSGKSDDTGTNAQRTNMRPPVSEGAAQEFAAQPAPAAPQPAARSLLPAEPHPQVDLRILPSSVPAQDAVPDPDLAMPTDLRERASLAPGGMGWEDRAQTLKPAAERESAPPSVSHAGVITREAEALAPLARAITGRRTITLTVRDGSAQRRIVLLGGDLVTAGSDAPNETLLEFLVERGDMLRAAADRAAAKIPAGGRYAAAALVARGVLHNDDMWEVLRAHALWLAGKAMQVKRGSYVFESSSEADADLSRLLSEPAVFGAKSGAEVFLEIVRRVVTRETAEAALGGNDARIFLGEHGPLLSESGLPEGEVNAIRGHEGHRLSELVSAVSEPDAMQIFYGLALLEIFRVTPAPEAPKSVRPSSQRAPAPDPIDDEARRSRIAARAALVQEGDYFALLGVPRQASSYEIRAAYLALRREFEPSRILTPQIADLAETVEKITIVLEEAYEVLRDEPRRERYLRAIVGLPRSS